MIVSPGTAVGVKVAVAVGPGEDAPPEQGKVAKVAMRVLNEVVNVLPGGEAHDGVPAGPSLWHQTPAIVDVPLGESWQTGPP